MADTERWHIAQDDENALDIRDAAGKTVCTIMSAETDDITDEMWAWANQIVQVPRILPLFRKAVNEGLFEKHAEREEARAILRDMKKGSGSAS